MKTKTKVATGAGGALAALAIIFSTILGPTTPSVDLSGTYEVSKIDDNKSSIEFKLPEDYTPGYAELFVNDIIVTESIVSIENTGEFVVVPLMTEGMDNLSIQFYHGKDKSGVGNFDADGVLNLKVKEDYVNEDENAEKPIE